MCGIVGFLSASGFSGLDASALLSKMTGIIRHRGPDDEGAWVDKEAGIALGHRRLSVIDLTSSGHQPMLSASGRYVLVFNGEIYDHLELRDRLDSASWRGHSDTETLLAAIERWGLEGTLEQATGMFALALWDRKERVLALARDRVGEKPLYYGWQGRTFLFGSELKALRAHPDFIGNVDRAALELYTRRGYVPTPRTIYSGLSKLIPGSILRISSERAAVEPQPVRYWSLEKVVTDVRGARFAGDAESATRETERLLLAAIQRQQIADVPVGAFLSGGVDSSVVVALMQKISARPVRTYTIGFKEKEYDEAAYARAVANHLGTDHTELYVSPQDAMDVIPSLPSMYDEPFADISQIPTTLVSRLARRDVTVALSGDGGDELFAGYDRYASSVATWRSLSRIPYAMRFGARLALPTSPLRDGLAVKTSDEFYQFKNSQWKGFPRLVIGERVTFAAPHVPAAVVNAEERLMYADATNYLPDDILVKVDRAAMSCSLETRIPMLDHHLVEFAWSLPFEIKNRNGVGKWPLKQILQKYVPTSLVDRPKMGFGVPMDHWLRGPLKEWAEDLLSEDKLTRDKFFDPQPIRRLWREHQSGKFDRHYGLWTVLMFQAWLHRNPN